MSDMQHPWRGLLVVTLICVIAGVFIFANYYYDAFPEASVRFDLPRAQALEEATEFLRTQGEEGIDQFHRTIIFSVDQMASIYLEREVGLERANRLMADSVAVWSWYLRYFKPLQKLEYEVHYTPSGRLVRYSRYIEENASGDFLSLDSARVLAQEYLKAMTGLSLIDLDEKIASSTDMPSRRDHNFEWEKRGFRAKKATLRYRVEIQGDEIGFFREYVKIPESWQRDYKKSRASNELFQQLAQFFMLLLGVGMVVTLFRQIRTRNLVSRIPFKVGVALAIGLVLVALNSLPLVFSGYDTTGSFTSFFLQFILVAVFGSAMVGAVVWLTAASGEPLYRRLLPEKLSLEGTFSPAGTRTRAFARATIAGYAMTFGHMGGVILFYLLGKKIGFWVPQEVDYTNAVSSYLPWLYPLAISFYAATFEEFGFRFFAIPFLKKIFRSTLPAVLVPALIWGFLHSSYPQEPGWVRGIEVGLIGVVAGYVMLRFGILATLVWHYTIDAFFIGFFLLKSGSTYLVISGVVVTVVLLIPLAIALIYVIRNKAFATQEGLTNRDLEASVAHRPEIRVAPKEAALTPEVTWQAPRWSRVKWFAWGGIIVIAVLLLVFIPLKRVGDDVNWSIGPEEAKSKAKAFLAQQNLPAEGWRCVVRAPQKALSGSTVRYLSREAGLEDVRQFVHKLSMAKFEVRFFKPLQKEMRIVRVNAAGEVIGFKYELDEETPGDSLTQDSARVLSETFLTRMLESDTSGFYLLSSGTNVRDARIDHHFTYQTDRDSVGPARLRVSAGVLGNQATGGGLYLHVPEEWERLDGQSTAGRTLANFLMFGLWGTLIVLIIVVLIQGIRSGQLKWGSGVRLALLWIVLALLSVWSRWDVTVAQFYDTSKPFISWMTTTLSTTLAGIIVSGLLIFSLVPLMRWQFEKGIGRPYSFSGWSPAPDICTRWQSIAGAILAIVGFAAISQFLWWLTLTLGLPTRTPPVEWITYAAEKYPFISLLRAALGKAIFSTVLIGFVLLWVLPRVRNTALRAAFIVLVPFLFALGEGQGFGEILGEWIRLLGVLLLAVFLLKNYLQQSPLALFAAIWFSCLIPNILLWLQQDADFYVGQGVIAIVFALLPIAFWMRRGKQVQVSGSIQ